MLPTGPIIALAALCGVCLADCGVPWWADKSEGIHATYNLTSGYYSVPMDRDIATKDGWVHALYYEPLNAHIYCMKGIPSYCAIYNEKKELCGSTICTDKKCLDASDYKVHEISSWNELEILNYSVYCVIYLYYQPGEIQSGGGQPCPKVGKELWKWARGSSIHIDLTLEELKKQSGTKGKCVPGQGYHWFLFTKYSDLTVLDPTFLVLDPITDHVTGVGWFSPKCCLVDWDTKNRMWKEVVSESALEYVLGEDKPDGLHGGCAVHTFLNSHPRDVTCP